MAFPLAADALYNNKAEIDPEGSRDQVTTLT
jgi:hypothetical protein